MLSQQIVFVAVSLKLQFMPTITNQKILFSGGECAMFYFHNHLIVTYMSYVIQQSH